MRALLIGLVLALIAAPALAFDDPKALVAAIYAPYQTPGQATAQDPAQYYSERLRGLVSGHAAKAAADLLTSSNVGTDTGDVAPVLGFNPLINGQQSLLMDLSIGEPVVVNDKAMVTVSFHNFDQSTLLALSLVKGADGWKVDDVASLGQGEHWLYSWLLQYDPFGVD
ncbi:MAG TPA: hypothetical protein VHB19_12595 [Devosia sp.]|nr:hypothetical protein [Devosia sp.]